MARAVDVATTADAARLGRWFLAFQGAALAATGWMVRGGHGDVRLSIGVGASVVVAAAASSRLPWHRLSRRAVGLYPALAFVALGALGSGAPTTAPPFIGLLSLWFMYLGVVAPVHTAAWLLPPAAVTYLVMLGQVGGPQLVRVVLSTCTWTVLADVLAMRAAATKGRTDDLIHQAETDALTGLPNRRALESSLEALAPDDVVVLIDLDHFKQVNDTFGHDHGDRVLRDFAATLQAVVRSGDVVARLGGEEFVLLLSQGSQGGAGAASVLARLRTRWTAVNPDLTWSAGATVHVAEATPHDTLRAADRALYQAKEAGRDRVVTSPGPTGGVPSQRSATPPSDVADIAGLATL